MTSDRRWLRVPFADKDAVKAIGGQWDGLVKMWWVPMHVPLVLVKHWVIE